MKKTLAILMSTVLATMILAGCSSNNDSSSSSSEETTTSSTEGNDNASGSVKTGLAVISTTGKSKDASDKDGLGQVDSTIVALTLDNDGKIVKCVIDAAQTKINFSAAGKVTTDLATIGKTKLELGSDYGMAKNSGIGKEWNEQAAFLADYVVGKTVKEVKAIAINDEGKATGEDLSASVTVSIGGYIDAIEKAAANAKDLGAKADDKLGLGVVTNIAKSKDAGEKDGLAQAYSSYAVSTFDKDGKITSVVIDASQTNVNFSTDGKITSDLSAENKTKLELGADYGMIKNSGIGKEWNEQIESFCKYVTGKTADEVKGIAVGEDGKATDSDLTASITVSLGDYIEVIQKANSNAK